MGPPAKYSATARSKRASSGLTQHGFEPEILENKRLLENRILALFMRIPMMSISRSEVMAISAERSDARLYQCESVIGIRQGF
jgi:hypothetical protein